MGKVQLAIGHYIPAQIVVAKTICTKLALITNSMGKEVTSI